MTGKSRNITYDIARAISMLWIIGVWHLQEYFPKIELLHETGKPITVSVLGVFTFMSGFFLGKKEVSPLEFYKTRIKRFYVLYFLACLTMTIGELFSWQQLFYSLTGLSCFILPQIKTLWFFSMMIILYIVTPFITHKSKCQIHLSMLLKSFFVWLVFLGISYITPIDERLLIYSPFYFVGLLFPFKLFEICMKYRMKLLLSALICFVVLYLKCTENIILSIFGFICIMSISDYIKSYGNKVIIKILNKIAYASMTAYLFHRHIYKVFKILFGDKVGFLDWYWGGIMVAVVMFVAYIIQYIYDNKIRQFIFRLGKDESYINNR